MRDITPRIKIKKTKIDSKENHINILNKLDRLLHLYEGTENIIEINEAHIGQDDDNKEYKSNNKKIFHDLAADPLEYY